MTAGLEAQLALPSDDLLGEAPFWDVAEQRLFRVDIARGLVLSWWPESGAVDVVEVGGRVSLAVPTSRGGLVVAVEDVIRRLGPEGSSTLCRIESDRPTTRLNDGACDDRGRLWVGTYSLRGEPEAGLYCVAADGSVVQVLDGMVASNGLAWTPDGGQMYVTDTARRRVTRYQVEPDRPRLVEQDVVVELSEVEGFPDGIATDVDGGLWVAVYGGAAIRRYADGRLDAHVELPVTSPTSLTFGGPGLDQLYVTTARHRLSASAYAGEPLAGGVFVVDSGRWGVGRHRFHDL